jgi:prepilin-type N-terminal cleavage/methylation domain-containing protein
MRTDGKKAFTLIEVLVTLAIILILAGALLTAGKYLRVLAERQLTVSAIEVIGTALQQYYDQTGDFPPTVYNLDDDTKGLSLKTVMSPLPVSIVNGVHIDDATKRACWTSETLFYFLDRVPQSKAVLSGLSNRMLTNKGKTGTVQVQIGATTYDWVRFVDAWGTAIAYKYTTGDAFPVLISAGPDKAFDTKDDLKSQ